jgi:hypothetical protein
MVEVILDQRLLRLLDRLLDRMQLLRDIEARATVLDHLHHAREVAVRALQPFDDRGMGVM